ncbi:MAG: hypothetical protein ABJN98_00100 [Roseibium sp.]
MRVNFTSQDQNFQTISDFLKDNLLARLDNAGNVGDPEGYPFLSAPPCRKLIAQDSYPLDFTTLGFAFKNSKDPVGQYPLRRIQACTENQACVSAGADYSSGDLEDPQVFNLAEVSEISKITTYYCETKSRSSSEAARYGRRIVAFVVTYKPVLQGSPEQDILFAASDSIFAEAQDDVEDDNPLLECIAAAVVNYNTRARNDYQIWPQVNDDGLKMLVTTNAGTVRRTLVNVAYEQFTGKSRSYVSNVSFLTAIPSTTQVNSLFQDLQEIVFDIPFVKNPLSYPVELTLERSVTDTHGNVTIYQKSSMHSFKIPSFKIGSAVEVGETYSYSTGQQFTDQKQRTRADGLKNNMKLTINAGSYVVRGYPATQNYNVLTVVGLIYEADGEPKFEISIPSGAPCIEAQTTTELAQSILGFI